ncbi:hypothetical protein BLX87_19320 [Bacillus sp. VT-16-64]|nr:hypothetical protein BLX87_19320 [Bacillus sp. VT-16-64]
MAIIRLFSYWILNIINFLIIGIHGTGWSIAIAVLKNWGKSPTWVTLRIAAVPALEQLGLKPVN